MAMMIRRKEARSGLTQQRYILNTLGGLCTLSGLVLCSPAFPLSNSVSYSGLVLFPTVQFSLLQYAKLKWGRRSGNETS